MWDICYYSIYFYFLCYLLFIIQYLCTLPLRTRYEESRVSYGLWRKVCKTSSPHLFPATYTFHVNAVFGNFGPNNRSRPPPLPLLEGSASATNWGKMPTGSSGSSYKVGSRGKKHESVRDVCSFGGQFLSLHSFFKCRGRSENENFLFDVFIFATTHWIF